MTQDPAQDGASTPVTGALVTSTSIPWPPRSGPGSDKEAWVAFAREVVRGSEEAREILDEQATLIASLEAELAQLRARLVEREPSKAQPDTPRSNTLEPSTLEPADGELADDTPRDTRRKMSESTKAAIRADLAAGLSQSEAARRNGVSAMSVSRLVRSA